MTARPALRWVLFAAAVLVNLVVLYLPRAPSTGDLPHVDKLVHVAVFAAVLVTGVGAGLARRWLAAVLAVHAVTSELVQHFLLAHRSGDPLDVLADLVGVGLGLLRALWVRERSGQGRRSGRSAVGRHPGAG